jgi:hypothetical protein
MPIYGTDPDEVRLGRLVDDEDPLFKRMRLFHFRFSTIYVHGAARRTCKALDYVTRIEPGRRYTHDIEAIGGTVRSDFEDAVRTVAEKARVRSGRTMECVVYTIVADLPQDSTEQSRRLAVQLVEAYWHRRGCAVLWAIHKPSPGGSLNWHAHIFLTARRVKRLPDKRWDVDRTEPAVLQKVWKRKQARVEYSRAINFACKPQRQFFPGTKFELCKQRGRLRLPQWLLTLKDRSEVTVRAATSSRQAADYALYALRWNDFIRLKRDPLEDPWIRERRHILREVRPGEPAPPALSSPPLLPPAIPSPRAVRSPVVSTPISQVSPKPMAARPDPARPKRPDVIHIPKSQPTPQVKPRVLTADEVTLL